MKHIKRIASIVLIMGSIYTTFNTYHYFFDTTAPELKLVGIEEGCHYGGDVTCLVVGHDQYKCAHCSVWIDEKPIVDSLRVNARSFEHQFLVQTKPIASGKHTIKLEVCSGAYARTRTTKEVKFVVDNKPLQVALIKPEADYKLFQGKTLHVQLQANKRVKNAYIHMFDTQFSCLPETKNSTTYEAFIPIACEEKAQEYMLTAEINDPVGNKIKLARTVQIIAFPFKKQLLKIDAEKVQQEKELGISNDTLEEEILQLVKQSPEEKLWRGMFCTPIEVQGVSTEFGTIRITQEKGRYMHKALDLLNSPKSVVWAPQDGVVVVKNRYAQSGNTVVIDHGRGIFSLLYHLDNFSDSIKVGETIRRGNPVGTLGKTGYARGYHVHWEVRINNIAIDPMQWIGQQL